MHKLLRTTVIELDLHVMIAVPVYLNITLCG